MKKPVSRILLINDEKLILKEFTNGLNAAAKSMENPLGIVFSGVTTAQKKHSNRLNKIAISGVDCR